MIYSIFKKEMKLFIVTPMFMIIVPSFVALCNFSFYLSVLDYLKLTTAPDQTVMGLHVWDFIFPSLFSKILYIFSIVIPVLTMRMVAEEKKTYTFDLMMSLPIKPFQYIWGKYLASLSFSFILLALTIICPLSLMPYTNIEWLPIIISYFGLFLYTSFYTAVGIYFSTLTSNQFIAGVATFGFSISSAVLAWLAYLSPAGLEKILAKLMLFRHVTSFFDGYIYISDCTLFISGAALFIYLAQRKVFIEYPTNF